VRVAVVGLYRSGSSFWAGVLHHLGVDMGAPFWENDVPHDAANHYESMELVRELPRVWNEPLGESNWSDFDRRRVLRDYIDRRGPIAGGKHPLFCLKIDDLFSAWGPDTKIIWSYRPLEDSCDSLIRSSFPWSRLEMYSIQHRLWKASRAHFRRRPPDLALNLFVMDADARRKAIDQVIDTLGLSPREDQVQQALAGYREHVPCSV
jgi:hypothetical protein